MRVRNYRNRMRLFLLFVASGIAMFVVGRTYERTQQQPAIETRAAQAATEARKMPATPPQPSAAWVHDPERRTALDEPAKRAGGHSR